MLKPLTFFIASAFLLNLSTPYSWSTEEVEEQKLLSTGLLPEEEEEDIADRDTDIPTLYDRNKMTLMHQRDRMLRRQGKCWPPPGVLVSPQIIQAPPNQNECFYEYDPRNPIYRNGRN